VAVNLLFHKISGESLDKLGDH